MIIQLQLCFSRLVFLGARPRTQVAGAACDPGTRGCGQHGQAVNQVFGQAVMEQYLRRSRVKQHYSRSRILTAVAGGSTRST